MRTLVVLAAACATALAAAAGGHAGQPVTQTLVPPPPPFETCKALGNGTLCEGSIAGSYSLVDTGIVCSGGFHVFDSASEVDIARRVYDANGFLVRRDRHDRSVGALSSPARGTSLPYTQLQELTDDLAVPGDLGSAATTLTGEFHVGAGAPVLIGAGRVVFAPDGTIEFQAGPTGFLDLIFLEPSAVAAVCDGLGG